MQAKALGCPPGEFSGIRDRGAEAPGSGFTPFPSPGGEWVDHDNRLRLEG